MDPIQKTTALIFAVTVVLIVTRKFSTVGFSLLGVIAMVVAGTMTDVEAFQFVDVHLLVILVSIWIIAEYFGQTGIPEYLGDLSLRLSRGNIPLFVTLVGVIAGFISMFVNNVVVVLMLAPVITSVNKSYGFKATGPILFIGLCSNFMGTALLLGDLPPQMLHSVTGIEFLGFIWQAGRPSSFPILTVVYLFVCYIFYLGFRRTELSRCVPNDRAQRELAGAKGHHIKDKRFAFIVCIVFVLTLFSMTLREHLGVKLGFISFVGSVALVLVVEFLRGPLRMDVPDLDYILSKIEWSAVTFYAALFALVGGLEHTGILTIVGNWFIPFLQKGLLVGTAIVFWVTAPLVGFLEHDAYILTLLYIIRDLGETQGIEVWPYYWAILWAGTLGSNLTIAGAPALYVAVSLGEKEDGEKFSLRKFFSYTVPYVLLSLVFCYILMVLVWVLPLMK
jgi:Na+/H+ antiporter NhaD/arsenite permease-like protein